MEEFINIYENALTDQECDYLINLFEKNKELIYEGGYGSVGGIVVNKNIKICNEIYLSKLGNNIERDFNIKLEKYFIDYIKDKKGFSSLDINNESWRLKRYTKNEGFFDWHVDNVPYITRVLAVIYYLNDVEEGGETLFKNGNRTISIKPKKGNLLIFPANFCFCHKGNIPISNDKYILVTFLRFKI